MIQKDLQGNLWECKIGTMSSGTTAREKTIGEDLSKQIIKMENVYVDIVRKRDKEIERLNNKIDKAIEYIEKVESVNKELKDSDMYWAYNTFFPELLDILKGKDE